MIELNTYLNTPSGDYADLDRQLKLTILALRQALEEGAVAQDEISRGLRTRYEGEINQLQGTVSALRAELEEIHHQNQAAIRHATAEFASENAQLRQTIASLREKLERSQNEHDQDIERVNARAKNAAIQMQATIRSLREQLEQTASRFIVQKQDTTVSAMSEINPKGTLQAFGENRGESPQRHKVRDQNADTR